jgi:carbonyl reductase 1
LGIQATKELEKINLKCNFHQLDIDDIESINRFKEYLRLKYEGIDILINNAGIICSVKNI